MPPGAAPPVVDGYDDLVEVGRGGFATVYRARDARFNRQVALKVFAFELSDEASARRFEQECRAMGELSWHPNVVVVHGSGTTTDDRPYLDMEYLERGSLADRMRAEGPLHWTEVLAAGVEVAGALATTHGAGTLHRDLKPENLLVGRLGEVKLGDFGIAIVEAEARSGSHQVGFTPSQAAPEVLRGEPPTERSDVYSLGSTLATLVIGRPPFVESSRDEVEAIAARVLTAPLPDLSAHGLPSDLEAFLRDLTAKDPQDRPVSALAVGRTLQGIQEAHGLRVSELRLDRPDDDPPPVTRATPHRPTPPPPPQRVSGEPGRRRWPWVAGGVVAALTSIVAIATLAAGGSDGGGDGTGDAGLPVSEAFVVTDDIAVGPDPEAVAVGEGAVWVVNHEDESLVRIDPDTTEVSDPVALGAPPLAVGVDRGAVWVGDQDGNVVRVDPTTLEVEDTVRVGIRLEDITFSEGSVWVVDAIGEEVVRIDPVTAAVDQRIAVGGEPGQVAAGAGAIWVTNDADGTVSRIDPVTGSVSETIRIGGDSRASVAVGAGRVWVTNTDESTLSVIDPGTNRVTDSVEIPERAYDVAVGEGGVWVSTEEAASAVRVDPETLELVDEVEDAGFGGRIAVGEGAVWLTRQGTDSLTRIGRR